jgi:hypothetical protein
MNGKPSASAHYYYSNVQASQKMIIKNRTCPSRGAMHQCRRKKPKPAKNIMSDDGLRDSHRNANLVSAHSVYLQQVPARNQLPRVECPQALPVAKEGAGPRTGSSLARARDGTLIGHEVLSEK